MIFGIGTDILTISSIEKVVQRHPKRFADKLLSPLEQEEYAKKQTPAAQINYLAKRWAAKEAFAKACGTGIRTPVLFPNISVLKDDLGKPYFQTHAALATWQEKVGIGAMHLSLSDEKDTLVAFVVLQKNITG